MKRSVINTNIEWAMDLCKELHFNLPDFAYWTPEDWEAKKDITDRMRKVAMGWDVQTMQATTLTSAALFCLLCVTARWMIPDVPTAKK